MAVQVKDGQVRPGRRVTIGDVACVAGVSKSTVSGVLNGRAHSGRVREETRQRIYEAVKQLNYVPASSAQALATGKTYNIGFLLSSDTTLGLANACFSTVLAGVQSACNKREYNCVPSACDLSDIKHFVMPRKLQRRSVDGVVITGVIRADVLKILKECNIPFVLSGDCVDAPLDDVLAVAPDMVTSWVNVLRKLADAGHRRIEFASMMTQSSVRQYEQAVARFLEEYPGDGFQITCNVVELDDSSLKLSEFERAFQQGQKWLERPVSQRPTAVISNDQWIVGFLSAVIPGGAKCPEDVSVVSIVDTATMEWYLPKISAIDLKLFESGADSADLLIDLLEKKIAREDAFVRAAELRTPKSLIMRDTIGVVPAD